ncbi:MAG: hypothetical protein ABJE95_20250 [Byssovorax sp.]
MHKITAVLFVALFSILFVACGGNINVSNDSCGSDSDCVPTTCCHATACGAKPTPAVACTVACTADCRGGTLDCGGDCFCDAGHCAAHLMP